MRNFAKFIAGALLVALSGAALAADESLIPNGSFEVANTAGTWPDKWSEPAGASWEEEQGNHFLRLTMPEPGKNVMVYWAFPVKPGQQYRLSFRARYKDIKPGQQPWFDGRVMMNFKDAGKKIVKGAPGAPSFRGTSNGWQEKSLTLNTPQGAEQLEIMFTLFQAQSGTLDFDDVKLVPVTLPASNPAGQ